MWSHLAFQYIPYSWKSYRQLQCHWRLCDWRAWSGSHCSQLEAIWHIFAANFPWTVAGQWEQTRWDRRRWGSWHPPVSSPTESGLQQWFLDLEFVVEQNLGWCITKLYKTFSFQVSCHVKWHAVFTWNYSNCFQGAENTESPQSGYIP